MMSEKGKIVMMRKLLNVFMGVVFLALISSGVYASEEENGLNEYVYTYSDGSTVVYMLDENGYPYMEENGEKIFLMIPVGNAVVTDEDLIRELEEDLPENPGVASQSGISLFSAPIPEVYLSGSSPYYYGSANVDNKRIVYSPMFEIASDRQAMSFSASNLRTYDGKKINLIYSYYDIALQEWSHLSYMGVDPTNRIAFYIKGSIQKYGRFSMNRSDNVISFDYTVFAGYVLA